MLGAGSWLAGVMDVGGGGLFLLRLLERWEVGVAEEDWDWALDLLLFGVPGGGTVSGEVPCLGSGDTNWVADSFMIGGWAVVVSVVAWGLLDVAEPGCLV